MMLTDPWPNFFLYSYMGLQINVEYNTGEIICRLGEEDSIMGRGRSLKKALKDLSKRVEEAVNGELSCSNYLMDELIALNNLAEQYVPDCCLEYM